MAPKVTGSSSQVTFGGWRAALVTGLLTVALISCGPARDPEAERQMSRLKVQVSKMATSIFSLKTDGIAIEGPGGFLATNSNGTVLPDLGQRELIQKENYAREQIFEMIAVRNGVDAREVGRQFAVLAGARVWVGTNDRGMSSGGSSGSGITTRRRGARAVLHQIESVG